MNALREHCDELQNVLAELIAPELNQHERGGPFIVLASGTGLACDGSFYGLTSMKMAVWLRDEIPDWRNGPAMLLNDSQILSDCGGCFEAAELTLNAIACHEISHCLLIPKLCSDPEPSDARERELFPQLAADSLPAAQYAVDAERRLHGPAFIRAALHVRWRMIQSGWSVSFGDLLDWQRFCGHPGEWVRMSLKDEFKRLQDRPLSEIANIPAPDEFLKLFEGSTVLVES